MLSSRIVELDVEYATTFGAVDRLSCNEFNANDGCRRPTALGRPAVLKTRTTCLLLGAHSICILMTCIRYAVSAHVGFTAHVLTSALLNPVN